MRCECGGIALKFVSARFADLYEGVRSIGDPDAFQRVINEETDDYVIANIRKQFWNGTGEKPWQVIEINRLLTRRNRTANCLTDQGKETQPEKRPSIKERIENNLVVFFLGTLLTGFLLPVLGCTRAHLNW